MPPRKRPPPSMGQQPSNWMCVIERSIEKCLSQRGRLVGTTRDLGVVCRGVQHGSLRGSHRRRDRPESGREHPGCPGSPVRSRLGVSSSRDRAAALSTSRPWLASGVGFPISRTTSPPSSPLSGSPKRWPVNWRRSTSRVNSVCPGYVRTGMQDREIAWEAELKGISKDEVVDFYLADTPLRRLQTSEEVASLILFLASESASSITGGERRRQRRQLHGLVHGRQSLFLTTRTPWFATGARPWPNWAPRLRDAKPLPRQVRDSIAGSSPRICARATRCRARWPSPSG